MGFIPAQGSQFVGRSNPVRSGPLTALRRGAEGKIIESQSSFSPAQTAPDIIISSFVVGFPPLGWATYLAPPGPSSKWLSSSLFLQSARLSLSPKLAASSFFPPGLMPAPSKSNVLLRR